MPSPVQTLPVVESLQPIFWWSYYETAHVDFRSTETFMCFEMSQLKRKKNLFHVAASTQTVYVLYPK